MRKTLLTLTTLAGLLGAGVAADAAPIHAADAAPLPLSAAAPAPLVLAQYYGEPGYGFYGPGPDWREREWRHHEWERHRREAEWHRWHDERRGW